MAFYYEMVARDSLLFDPFFYVKECGGELLSRVGSCLERIVREGGWDGALDWVPWYTQNITSSDKI